MMIHFFHEGFDSKYISYKRRKYISYKIAALHLSKSKFRLSHRIDKIQNLNKVG